MDILLISDSKKLQELLSFQLTARLPISIRESATSKEGLEFLNGRTQICELVVAPFSGSESPIIQTMRDKKPYLPIIFYFDPMISEPVEADFAGITLLGLVEMSKLVEGVTSIIQKFMDALGVKQDPMDYCPIRTNLLLRVNPLKADIFIRLSLQKYVKVFASESHFTKEDLDKYAAKDVEYLFVRREDADSFIAKFQGELDQMLNRDDLKPAEAMAVVEETQDVVQELFQRVGFNEEVQGLAKKSVQLTMKAIGKNPTLGSLLERLQNNGNYLSQHSTLLAEISCCIAKEMEWGSESSFSKLVLASLMHDIALINPDLAKINTLKELEANKAKFPAEMVKAYNLHSVKAADVVRSFKEIPADVDVIVSQHHERPDGGGFPRGLSHMQIAPLGALFIVAHDLTQHLLEQKEKFSLPAYIADRATLYSAGNFKKIMAALGKVKI
jgi:HD-GYP domain-containing protein (c-di-GMP phosphodiesterase class II)